jgi:glycosyltransferase involved in cell wall biosynthesis
VAPVRFCFSTAYSQHLGIESHRLGSHDVVVVPRSSDWGKRGVRKYLHHVREGIRVARQARDCDVLVLCTAGIEVFVVAAVRTLLPSNYRCICADFLIPKQRWLRRFGGRLLPGVDAFICIRSGDIDILHSQFNVPRRSCRFLPFPVTVDATPSTDDDEGYIYSAGWAHRDWPTLLGALGRLPYRAILSAGRVDVPADLSSRIKVLEQCSPEQGRSFMRNSRLVALAFHDTQLPSGPLILLDAMAMGKPVVASNVNGTRDYVDHGRTGIMVPPSEPEALANAIERVMTDPSLRCSLGNAAYEKAATFTAAAFVDGIVKVAERLVDVRSSARQGRS